jgi:hypothetical protein
MHSALRRNAFRGDTTQGKASWEGRSETSTSEGRPLARANLGRCAQAGQSRADSAFDLYLHLVVIPLPEGSIRIEHKVHLVQAREKRHQARGLDNLRPSGNGRGR